MSLRPRSQTGNVFTAASENSTRTTAPSALWVSTSTETKGGIATYVRRMQHTPLWTEWGVRHVVSHRDGSAATKMSTFARAMMLFVYELFRSRPDIVHLHASSDTSLVRKGVLLWVSWAARVPVVVHMHGSGFHDQYGNAHRLIQKLIRTTLGRASVIVALGSDRAERLESIVPSARIALIPNAVRIAQRVRQPAAGKPVHVVFVGRIGERKGTFRLLDAWSALAADPEFGRGKAATLTIAGDGDVEQARERVRELDLQDSVQVSGWLSEDAVGELLDSAQVMALPSWNEGQPMAVLEAMARGLCVIASDVGGIPDMIGGGCGLLVAPDDIEGITAALRLVVYDDAARAHYGRAAHTRVAERFDVDTVWRRLDTLYREVSQ